MRRLYIALCLFVVVMMNGCGQNSTQGRFKDIFGFPWLSGIELKVAQGPINGDPIFHAIISKEQAGEIGRRARCIGYEEWRVMLDGETYGNSYFNIESRREAPITTSLRKHQAGHRFRLFFNESTGDFYAVSFFN